MKKILFLIIFPCILSAQGIVKTVGIVYTAGAPAHAPAAKVGSQVAIDTATWEWYEYNGSAWIASGDRVQSISGCSTPNYTPTKYQSKLVINACSAGQGGPELYYWTGAAWLQINEGQTYSEGTGIDITGGVITNTAPDISISITEGGGINVTGTYPDFVISNTATNYDTVYVLISGQSNAWGASAPFQGDTTGSSKVQAWNGSAWTRATINQPPFRCSANNPTYPAYNGSNNFGLHFCKNVQKRTGAIVRMILVPYDGDPIRNWIPSSSTNFSAITSAISASATAKIDYFLWHQGEADNSQTGGYYDLKFDTLKQQLRAQSWFPKTTPIVVGGLLPGGSQSAQTPTLARYDYGTDPYVAYATSAGLSSNGIDNLHFSGASLVEMGLRYYTSAMSLPRPSSQQGANPLTDIYWKRNGQQLHYDSASVYLPNTSQQFAVGSTPTGDGIASTISSSNLNNTPFQGQNTDASGISGASFLSNNGNSLAFFGYANPSNSFVASDATLISSYPSKPIVFGVNGSEQARITSGGLFVGKSSSSYKFDVAGSARIDNDLSVGTNGFFQNVGIGVSSTSRNLDIVYSSGSLGYRGVQVRNSDVSAGAFLSISNHDDTNGLLFGYINSGASFLGGDCGFFNTYSTKPLVFATNSIERIRIKPDGKVGIGTGSPSSSSIVDISSTSAGLLPPRMTAAQRDVIGSPATGLTLYCTDCTATDTSTGVMQVYNGSTWKNCW